MIEMYSTSEHPPPINSELLIWHEFMHDYHIILYSHEDEMNYFKWWALMPIGEPQL